MYTYWRAVRRRISVMAGTLTTRRNANRKTLDHISFLPLQVLPCFTPATYQDFSHGKVKSCRVSLVLHQYTSTTGRRTICSFRHTDISRRIIIRLAWLGRNTGRNTDV